MKNLMLSIALATFTVVNVKSQTVFADFYANNTNGCLPVAVNFINNSEPQTGITCKWNFGNGTYSDLFEPSVVYTEPGSYDVSLIVSNGNYSDTLTLLNYITVYQNPVADFVIEQNNTGCAPYEVNFKKLVTQGDAPVIFYNWDLGNGVISNLPDPKNIYEYQNNFAVSLFVVDANGCKNTTVKNNYINVYKPAADFSVTDSFACVEFLNAEFINNSSGDGNFSELQNPEHLYTSVGNFDVSLAVTDEHACSDTILKKNLINIEPVIADFNTSADTVCAGTQIFFTNLSSGGKTYSWNFGDGTLSAYINPSHTFNQNGNFEVKLITLNADNCSDTITKNIFVESAVANFSVSQSFSCQLPVVVNYVNNSENAVSWFWNFADGNTSYIENPVKSFNAEGTFVDTLTVYSLHGCKSTYVNTEGIKINKPKAYFTPNAFVEPLNLGGCVPVTVNFENKSVYFSETDSIVSYRWNFGDGTFSYDQNASHVFTEIGQYVVTIRVTTASGCMSEFYAVAQAGTKTEPRFL